jgi:hypothetical protein
MRKHAPEQEVIVYKNLEKEVKKDDKKSDKEKFTLQENARGSHYLRFAVDNDLPFVIFERIF